MSDENNFRDAIKEISKEFAGLLTQSNKASEERHTRTDGKLDRLIETITENTIALRSTQDNQKYQFERMERIEANQKEQGEKIQTMAESLILINDRREAEKEARKVRTAWISSVSGAVVAMALAVWWGLK